MDQVYIQALLRKALIAYAQGGTEALGRWKNDLPPDQLAQLEEHCAGPLSEAIAALAPVLGETVQKGCKHRNVVPRGHNELVKGGYVCLDCGAIFKSKPDPRKTHRVDRRRTKPL